MLIYLKNRLLERSTWLSLLAGVPIASVAPTPWNFAALAFAVIGVLVPTK